jgi:hypothetical protein
LALNDEEEKHPKTWKHLRGHQRRRTIVEFVKVEYLIGKMALLDHCTSITVCPTSVANYLDSTLKFTISEDTKAYCDAMQ